VRVRRAIPADRPAIWALNDIPNIGATADPTYPLDLRPRDEPPQEFPDLAEVPDSFTTCGGGFYVVEADGRLVGMGGYKPGASGDAQVLRVRVHPAMRRQGVGRLIMRAIEESAAAKGFQRLILETADNQPEAISFYEAIGYQRTGIESQPEWNWTLIWLAKNVA
jgi:ribosomal protein S18 acetylase RimI-like enzyme